MATSMTMAMALASSHWKACNAFGGVAKLASSSIGVTRSTWKGQEYRLFGSVPSTAEEEEEEIAVVAESSSSIYDSHAEDLSKVKSKFLQTMRDRGFLHQCTNLVELDAQLTEQENTEGGALPAYLGFDATADSLHVGSLLQIMILRHLQQSGHRPIVLVGGGTSKVGDPTGKDESRQLLTDEAIQKNIDGISKAFKKFIHFAPTDDDGEEQKANDAIMVNNDDWLSTLNYMEFLRDYGTQFTINRMLSFESVKQRLTREAPFSFLEFNYMILQAYDFLELNRRHKAKLQLGGSDQWGNIVAGTELGRRCDSVQLFGLTAPLITTSDGKKMGKTANGAVWLNQDKLSEYDYWQFWRNTADADVIRFIKLFTELSLEDVAELEKLKGADINKAKVILADEATALLHGKETLSAIHKTVNNMFKGGGVSTDSLPRIFVTKDKMTEDGGISFADLFLQLKLASSKKEARRLIQGGGARLGDEKITDQNGSLNLTDFDDSAEVTLRAGKKRAGVVELQ